jgi:hypothetical protein
MTKSLDQGQIKVGGSSQAYDDEVARIVSGAILTSVTGRAIATKIKAHGEVLITDDYNGIDSREINSDFQPGLSSRKLGIIGFHPHNRRLNTVDIVFNGKPISPKQLKYIHEHSPGQTPDQILCHELLHAARYLGGDYKKTPIPKMPEYENEEEYFAVLVTNIYSSEKGRGFESLRKSHHMVYKPEMNPGEFAPFVFMSDPENFSCPTLKICD